MAGIHSRALTSDPVTSVGGSGGSGATASGAGGGAPIRWPDSVTKLCRDATSEADSPPASSPGYGQDGNYLIAVPHYSDNGDGTRSDDVSGLTWQAQPSATIVSLADAMEQCKGAWRMPTWIELSSLVDWGRKGPSLDPVAFPGQPGPAYWSRTPGPAGANTHWGVNVCGYMSSK